MTERCPVLYIDVDDTLVKWTTSDEANGPEAATPNKAIIKFAENWDGMVVVWSGGGRDYAETWGLRLLRHVNHVPAAKHWLQPWGGDVFIDDSPFDCFKTQAIHPSEVSL